MALPPPELSAPLPAPPPPIGRTDADDIDRQKDTERIFALFNPELREILSRVAITRVLGSALPNGSQGWYTAPNGPEPSRVSVAEDAPTPYSDILRHELLHAANAEYEPFAADARRNWQGLWGPLNDAYQGRMPPHLANDPAHAFTFAAEQSLMNPAGTPLDVYRYFLPLRQGVPTD